MSMELAIAIAGIIGLIVGLAIGRQGRKERDQRIREIEYDLSVRQNVIESNSDTINRLRRENERLKDKIKKH